MDLKQAKNRILYALKASKNSAICEYTRIKYSNKLSIDDMDKLTVWFNTCCYALR